MRIEIPELSLVLLVGPSGSGKSTFARTYFKATEVISSDACRGMITDDENDQEISGEAFDLLGYIAGKRLAAGRLAVIDATNVSPDARRPLIELARQHHVLPIAIVLNMPEGLCQERNASRADRDFGSHVIRRQRGQLLRSLRGLEREGIRYAHIINSPEQAASVEIVRKRLWSNLKHEGGPFDIIGDLHGCCDELEALLEQLGYNATETEPRPGVRYRRNYSHPAGRRVIFVGDIVDRGPRILDTFDLVRNMVRGGAAFCVPGNHDVKLLRKLRGKNVQMKHGLEKTVQELEALPEEIRSPMEQEMSEFIDALVSHHLFDEGKLVVAHAGMKESMQGRASGAVRSFALYGETTGETDEFGLPVRHNWAAQYRGKATVVYGHTPVPQPEWLNQTINVDTGCVFGGALTALRYPELQLVSVPAREMYAEPARPFALAPDAGLTAQQEHDTLLDISDVTGKRIVETRLLRGVTIREENSIAALEVMSRFAVDPRWLIHLPPTMSPTGTSTLPGTLEHPSQAFQFFRDHDATHVICEEKHMGSRAIVIVCRTPEAARKRFGVLDGSAGTCYTRTGRPFFNDPAVELEMLARVRGALDASGFWDEQNTDWVCLDCELMPWSAKAQELLRRQYAAVGAASGMALPEALRAMQAGASRGLDLEALLARYSARNEQTELYRQAYRRYCWPVASADDLRLAPFHILATEGAVHTDKSHRWHMETIARIVDAQEGPTLMKTSYMVVDLADPESERTGIAWWEELTGRGGEGMVVKPIDFILHGKHGLSQPAIKCRGREYLRIIYGPEYTAPEHLEELRQRHVGLKRSLALREFALGVESLERFVRREPLRRVHECVFGVLAMESEAVDPRL